MEKKILRRIVWLDQASLNLVANDVDGDNVCCIYSNHALDKFYSDEYGVHEIDRINVLKILSLFDRKMDFANNVHYVEQFPILENDRYVIQTIYRCSSKNNANAPAINISGYGSSFERSYLNVFKVINCLDMYILGKEPSCKITC